MRYRKPCLCLRHRSALVTLAESFPSHFPRQPLSLRFVSKERRGVAVRTGREARTERRKKLYRARGERCDRDWSMRAARGRRTYEMGKIVRGVYLSYHGYPGRFSFAGSPRRRKFGSRPRPSPDEIPRSIRPCDSHRQLLFFFYYFLNARPPSGSSNLSAIQTTPNPIDDRNCNPLL